MAISTYAELQTAVSNWLDRSDLSSRIPEFIVIGEARIGREVRSRLQEQRVTATTDDYVNVPSDFLEMRSVWLTTSGRIIPLQYVATDALFTMYPTTTSGCPKYFTIFGDEIRFGPLPDSSYTIELWYYKKLEALADESNALFTRNPDLYLYAALCAAVPFLKNDNRIQVWESLYQQVKNQVNENERKGRESTAMQMRVA